MAYFAFALVIFCFESKQDILKGYACTRIALTKEYLLVMVDLVKSLSQRLSDLLNLHVKVVVLMSAEVGLLRSWRKRVWTVDFDCLLAVRILVIYYVN